MQKSRKSIKNIVGGKKQGQKKGRNNQPLTESSDVEICPKTPKVKEGCFINFNDADFLL